ncbi:MAG: hypothetical protein AAGF35_12535 [Pseudomonadota bacterium]
MQISTSLDRQVYALGYWSAIAGLAVAVIAVFLPLDAPGGYEAGHTERINWLADNRDVFTFAWVIQILSMTTLTLALFAFAWQIAARRPLRSLLAVAVLLVSFVAFIIPKFIAVWSIPLLVEAVTGSAGDGGLANTLLLVLNVSVPYSLFTSFDYLGFWLYAVFALMVAGPLLAGPTSSKLCGGLLGLYGIAYHAVVFGVLLGAVLSKDVEFFALSVALLLLLTLITAVFNFRVLITRAD